MIPVSVDEVAFVRSDTLSGAWLTRPSELDAPDGTIVPSPSPRFTTSKTENPMIEESTAAPTLTPIKRSEHEPDFEDSRAEASLTHEYKKTDKADNSREEASTDSKVRTEWNAFGAA